MTKAKRINILSIILISMVTCALMFALNQVTAFRSDDFGLMKSWRTGQPTQSFSDIFYSQLHQYLSTNGRVVAHVIGRILLWWKKPYSSLLNAIVIAALNLICCCYSKNRNAFTLLMSTALIYFLNPDFDGTCNWIAGSVNYVWTITICLLFLLPYLGLLGNKTYTHTSVAASAGLLLLGVLAGWTNENIGPTLVLMVGVIIIDVVKSKRYLPKWTITGELGLLTGTIFMLAAPGNRLRAEMINPDAGLLKTLMLRGYYMERAIFSYLFPTLLLGGVLLLTLWYVYHELPDKTACLFIAAGIVSVGAMILSPTYPPRATFGSMIFFIIAILRMIDQILDKNEKFLRVRCLTACFGYLAFAMQMLTAVGYMTLKSVSVMPDFL